jgi:hypothetical protein
MEVRMKKLLTATGLVAAAIMAVTGPAYAPSKGDGENMLQKQIDAEHKRENKDIDKAYNDTIKHTGKGGATKPYDPWGSVRPTEANKKTDPAGKKAESANKK